MAMAVEIRITLNIILFFYRISPCPVKLFRKCPLETSGGPFKLSFGLSGKQQPPPR
jgi:hypothetical protein